MAVGWARDGAVQDQIDANIDDAVKAVRSQLAQGKSLTHCENCDVTIPKARQKAVQGVRYCVRCQEDFDEQVTLSSYNRRGCKDSQLR